MPNDGRNRGGRDRQPQPLTLKLSNTPPEKKGDAWETLVTAVLGRGERTISDKEIKFFLDGAEKAADLTDDDGNASATLKLKPGKHLVKAQVAREATYRTVTIEIEKPKETVIGKPVVHVCRNGDTHVFRVQVNKSDGKPHQCKVQVLDPTGPCSLIELDENGNGSHEMVLADGEPFRFLTFVVLGTTLKTMSAGYARK